MLKKKTFTNLWVNNYVGFLFLTWSTNILVFVVSMGLFQTRFPRLVQLSVQRQVGELIHHLKDMVVDRGACSAQRPETGW